MDASKRDREGIEEDEQGVASGLADVASQLARVERDIGRVEEELARVGEKLSPLEDKVERKSLDDDDRARLAALRKEKEQLRKEKEQLRKKEEQLRKKEEQLREEKRLLLLRQVPRIPLLGDVDSMYDIWTRLSAKSSSTSGKYAGPSFHKTSDECPLSDLLPVPSLPDEEFHAVLREPNQLWEETFKGVQKAVAIGSTESVVDDYVAKVIKSVANALHLDIRLEQQTWINGIKADHWVVKVLNETVAILVGSEESKLPRENYGVPYVLDDVRLLVQLRRQLLEVHSYYGTTPVYGIGSTGREWRFFQLPCNSESDPKTPVRSGESAVEMKTPSWGRKSLEPKRDGSPPTTSIGPDNVEDADEGRHGEDDGEEGQFEEQVVPGLLATQIYKWNDREMLRVLGGVLSAMCRSARSEISVFSPETLSCRLMWFLVRRDDLRPWGWARLCVEALHWGRTMRSTTSEVVVLCCLGHGADGKALLVSNHFGEIGVLKLCVSEDWVHMKTGRSLSEDATLPQLERAWESAQREAENWRTVYKGYKWASSVRAEKWMGLPSVVMPRFNQFTTPEGRKNSLEAVRACLEQNFVSRGFVHGDVAWRNVAYFKSGNVISVVMLDLSPTRVKARSESDLPEDWVNAAIDLLKSRCSMESQL